MRYNVCETCGAKDGRAGLLICVWDAPNECLNCHDTRKTGNIVVHADLDRTSEELRKTMAILDNRDD